MGPGRARADEDASGVAGPIAVVDVEGSRVAAVSSRIWERWGVRIASPAAILITLPALVAVVGTVLSLSAYSRMKELGEQASIDRFAERARQAEHTIASTIAQADALLDRTRGLVRAHSSHAPRDLFASSLRDLGLERRGLKWLSVSFPNGTFQGIFIESGVVRYQESSVDSRAQTIMRQYDFTPAGLSLSGGDAHHYDPREREFYRQAVAEKGRVWTQPYPFYPDFRSGITRAEAVYDREGKLQAVITADYDIAQLSGVLHEHSAGADTEAVFSSDGALLALSGERGKLPEPGRKSDRPLRFSDLKDPVLTAFFASRAPESATSRGPARAALPATEVVQRVFDTPVGRYFAVERPLRFPQGLGWRLVALTNEAELSRFARGQARASLISSSSFLAAAIALSAVFAFGVGRVRTARRKAERRAASVLERARELGSYQLERRIGSGGMGEVWSARHRLLARPAAIKLIRPERLGYDREKLEARFEREARVLSSLRSPNTVSVFDFGRTLDGRLFLAMELLEGLTLDRVLKVEPCLPAARVIDILIGACRSLSEAHAAGLVHRDIKPSNLFLCYDGDGLERVKVIDFGLVKSPGPAEAHLSQDGSVSGTPEYMAPEQARGEELDGRTDLYALGCTAFHLLAGRPVFSEPSDVATLLAHQMQTPPSLSETATQSMPRELDQLVSRCLAKDPEFRPRSAASLGRALSAIVLPEEQRTSPQVLREWWDRHQPA